MKPGYFLEIIPVFKIVGYNLYADTGNAYCKESLPYVIKYSSESDVYEKLPYT